MDQGNNINNGNQPASDNNKAAALDSITNDMNAFLFSYKIVHKYRSLFCSYFEDVNRLYHKIHLPKIECVFLINKDVTVFLEVRGNVDKRYAFRYNLKELIELCSAWDGLSTWYKQYNEQTLNGTIYDE